MLYLRVPVLKPIQVQQQKVLTLYLFAHSYVVPCWRYRNAFNRLHVVRQLNKLHSVRLECLLDNHLPHSVHHLHLAVLLYYTDLVLALQREVRTEGVVEIQIDLFLLLLHLNIESCNNISSLSLISSI